MAAIVAQFSRWGEYTALNPDNALGLEANIFQETPFDVPASMEMWIQNLQASLPQQLANIQPAMFGGNMEDQKTAKAYAQAKDMSLGVMAIVWTPYLEFKSGICWQAARLSAQREETKISVVLPQKNGRSKTISLDTSVLGRGGFVCKPVSDQNFPESHTDKANKWMGLYQAAEQNPQGISAQLFREEPDNLVAFKDATGLDLVIKGAAARDKQLAEWEMMQSEDGPIPDIAATEAKQQAAQQQAQQVVSSVSPGAQAPPVPPPQQFEETSSVPIRLADDHIEEARTCVRILNDAKTLEMLTTQQEVVHDLELHLIAHLTKAQQSGIVIPPDLLGIVPPPAPPPLPGVPGAPGSVPSAAGPPGAPHPALPKSPGGPALPGAALPPPIPIGGSSAAISA